MTGPTGDDDFSAVCPYLGLNDDADSHATYPTDAHRCYRVENPTRIASGHQQTYCLETNHVSCPVFRGEGIAATTAPAGAATASAAGASAAGRGAPGAAPTRPQPGSAPRGASGGAGPFASGGRRGVNPGSLGPRPRPGGISMPVATIGLFAAAIVVIALAFFIQSVVGGGGDDNTPIIGVNQSPTPNGTQAQRTGTAATTAPRTPGTGTPATAGTGTPAASATAGTGGKTYTVQSGDFCGSIAQASGITLEALLQANNMTEAACTSLQVGQVLKLP